MVKSRVRGMRMKTMDMQSSMLMEGLNMQTRGLNMQIIGLHM